MLKYCGIYNIYYDSEHCPLCLPDLLTEEERARQVISRYQPPIETLHIDEIGHCLSRQSSSEVLGIPPALLQGTETPSAVTARVQMEAYERLIRPKE